MPHSNESIDTNILLRLLLQDVPAQHLAAIKLLHRSKGHLVVADIAVIEVVFVLSRAYQFSRQQVAEAIDGVMQTETINCNQALFRNVLPHYLTHPKLSFEDCCLAEYAKLNSAEPLWTFDKKLASQIEGVTLLTT